MIFFLLLNSVGITDKHDSLMKDGTKNVNLMDTLQFSSHLSEDWCILVEAGLRGGSAVTLTTFQLSLKAKKSEVQTLPTSQR